MRGTITGMDFRKQNKNAFKSADLKALVMAVNELVWNSNQFIMDLNLVAISLKSNNSKDPAATHYKPAR